MPDGYFLETAYTIDETGLEGKDLGSDEFKQFVINLKNKLDQLALAANDKDTGYYNPGEWLTNKLFFSGTTPNVRGVLRQVIDFGALNNAVVKTAAHNIPITNQYRITSLTAYASDPVNFQYISIPFVNVSGTIAAGNIEIYMDNTFVYIQPVGNATNFTTCYVIIEYTTIP